jgi:hypothetical protein
MLLVNDFQRFFFFQGTVLSRQPRPVLAFLYLEVAKDCVSAQKKPTYLHAPWNRKLSCSRSLAKADGSSCALFVQKHSRAQMLKQARDFSDLLGSGGPASREKSHTPEAQKTGVVPRKPEQQRASNIGRGETMNRTLREAKQKLGEMQKRLDSRVSPKTTPGKQPVRPVTTARHSSESKSRRPEADQHLPRKEAPSKGGLAISSHATVTPEGALVANRGLSLEEAKRLKKGAKLLGMKLYFESDDKERLKEEKTRQERRAAGRGAAESGKAVEARVLGAKTGGSKSGVPPRSLDEERRRGVPSGNGSIVKAGAGKVQTNGGKPAGVGLKQARLDSKAPHTLQRTAPSSFGRDRASVGPPRGNGFLPYQERPGQLKRKYPDEEESDSFLDEGGEEDEEEGPSREAVSSLIRKMFRWGPGFGPLKFCPFERHSIALGWSWLSDGRSLWNS